MASRGLSMVCALATSLIVGSAHAQSPAEETALRRSVAVRTRAIDGTVATVGAGIILARSETPPVALIATAGHVVVGQSSAWIQPYGSGLMLGSTVAVSLLDEGVDLAFLEIRGEAVLSLPDIDAMAPTTLTDLNPAAAVRVTGCPGGSALALLATQGRLASGLIVDRLRFAHPDVREGHSGGGLFAEDNEGLVLAGLIVEDEGASAVALPIRAVLDHARNHGLEVPDANRWGPQPMCVFSLGAMTRWPSSGYDDALTPQSPEVAAEFGCTPGFLLRMLPESLRFTASMQVGMSFWNRTRRVLDAPSGRTRSESRSQFLFGWAPTLRLDRLVGPFFIGVGASVAIGRIHEDPLNAQTWWELEVPLSLGVQLGTHLRARIQVVFIESLQPIEVDDERFDFSGESDIGLRPLDRDRVSLSLGAEWTL